MKKQSEFVYSKENDHLPMFGVGPIYVWCIGIITLLAVILEKINVIPVIRVEKITMVGIILGAVMIAAAIYMWCAAVLRDQLDSGIKENRLVITGIYSHVRNPIYSAFMFLCAGVLLMNGNIILLILPVLYWLFMTVLMKHTEEKWLKERYGAEYDEYCKTVNRCIPWFRRKEWVQVEQQ